MKRPKTDGGSRPVATPTRIQELADLITLARVKRGQLQTRVATLNEQLEATSAELDGVETTIAAACREMDKQTAGPVLPR